MIRVLISIAPRSYRESLAIVLQRDRPDAEVRVCNPGPLEQETRSFEPHLLICNDDIHPGLKDLVHSRVEILFKDDLHANVSVDGSEQTIRDVSISDLLKVMDETDRIGGPSDEPAPELPR